MAQTAFFATKDDLLPVLSFAERAGALKYGRTGVYPSPHFESFSRGADIPDLGRASAPSAVGCASFLVCATDSTVKIRHRRSDGIDRYFVDQLFNTDTVTFSPGGAWNQDIYLYGRVATASTTETSKQLMKRFRAGIRKYFVTIGAYYVGPEARRLLTEGKRLTIAQQSPPQFDLIIPNAGS
jgi:hypothetical protein